ncbi:SAM-dependent methyltransferase [Brevibacillus halotolerans]|uniref:class I SAM-dependent methyltransferase n=1 Tax=Brevibacillus halotolerans TaxID=1507437 RepID=UPI001B0F95A9|nr:methyltransferase domain-containing protein [Brevibacillus halotolerans]GIO01250.1 SAM-dependent methyltransferase [Brevibacillus halotolerans]
MKANKSAVETTTCLAMHRYVRDKVRFFTTFVKSPREVGSVTPSSARLSSRMLEGIDWAEVTSVVELGAGTGVFTQKLKQKISPNTNVFVYEQDVKLRADLQERFPSFHHHCDAQCLSKDLKHAGVEQVDVIISGLPFMNFPQELRERIIAEVMQSLKPGGAFIAFQYSLQMRKQLKETFREVSISFEPLNIPPAFVYRCRK